MLSQYNFWFGAFTGLLIAAVLFNFFHTRVVDPLNQKIQNLRNLQELGLSGSVFIHEISSSVMVAVARLERLHSLIDLKESRFQEFVSELYHLKNLMYRAILRAHRANRVKQSSRVDLTAVITEIFELYSERFQKHGIELRCVHDNPRVEVHSRAGEIAQILFSLFDNIEIDSPPLHRAVEVRVSNAPNCGRVTIMDDGSVFNGPHVPVKIAQDIAKSLNGTLIVDGAKEHRASGRNSFVLELPLYEQS